MAAKIVAFRLGFIQKPVPWGIPVHDAWEKNTDERLRFRTELRYFIPLKKNGQTIGMVGVNRSDLLPNPGKG